MMPLGIYDLDNELREQIYRETILPSYFEDSFPSSSPSFHILAGQPGAGKTALREYIRKNQSELKETKPLVINTDDLREFHPFYEELIRSPTLSTVIAAPSLVSQDTNHWFRLLLNDALSSRRSVIFDTTLGGPTDGFSETLDTLLSFGYSFHLHVLSVRKEVSTLGIYLRFLQQVKRKGAGRMVDIGQTHDVNYKNLSPNITFLLSLPQAKEISSSAVYNKNISVPSDALLNSSVAPIYTAEKSVDINKFIHIIESEREREFTESERHYYQHKIEETEMLIKKHRPELRDDFMRNVRALKEAIDDRQ